MIISVRSADPFDKTNLSRLNHLEFLGLALRNLVETKVVCKIARRSKMPHTAKRGHERREPSPEAHLKSWNFINI